MYIDSVMNYTGSKFKLLDQILPLFDYTKLYFVDVFTGGGSIYTNVSDKYQKIIVNDIISDLIGIHQNLILGDDIIQLTKELCPGKDNAPEFAKLRESYNQEPSPEKLWALMLSSTNNMMRFNQKFKYNQTYGNRGWNSNTDKKVELFINHIRQFSEKIKFTSKPFYELPVSSDKIMFYCDPPYGYVKTESGGIGRKQISEAGYNAFWKTDDDIKLFEFLLEIDRMGSSFMISGVLNHGGKTSWILDKLISNGYFVKNLEFHYNKVSRSGDKETNEIIITNYKI